MRINIITNLTQGCGLAHDYALLRGVLEEFGHSVIAIDFQNPRPSPADLNIFLEVVVPSLYRCAPVQWLMPNPEWWPENIDLNVFARVLCKTRAAFRAIQALIGARARYVGFVSRDLYRPEQIRDPYFLHVAGKSEMKNTGAVLEAWRELPYPLTVVTHWPAIAHRVRIEAQRKQNVRLFYSATEQELVKLMNNYRFHVCPSKTEGWGHYLHEGLGVGACVLATDAPPMNEFDGLADDLLIPARESGRLRLATLYDVDVQALRDVVHYAAGLSAAELFDISTTARAGFLRDRDGLRVNLATLLEGTW